MRIRTLLGVATAAGAFSITTMPVQAQEIIDGPKVSWNLSTWGTKRAFTAGIEYVAAQLAERTGGKFTIKVHYGEALSKARENFDGIKLGAFQAAQYCNFYHPGKNPVSMALTLPFLPLGDLEVSMYVREAVAQHPDHVKDMDNWNAMFYLSALLPQYEFMGRGEPPTKLTDWNDLRVRAGGGLGMAMQELGASLTTVAAPEVYTGIERGTMDAASFPYTYSHESYKLHEISDWFTSNMSPGTTECATVFNKDAYAKLPDEYKKLLAELKAPAYEVQIKAYHDIDEVNLPMFREKLTEVVYTEEQLDEFRKIAAQPVWDKWVADNKDKFDSQGVLDLMLSEAKKAAQK